MTRMWQRVGGIYRRGYIIQETKRSSKVEWQKPSDDKYVKKEIVGLFVQEE